MNDIRLESMAREGQLDDPRVRDFLDQMPVATVISMLGTYTVQTKTFQPVGGEWTPGKERPILADENPAVMAAIGRCAAARMRHTSVYGDAAITVSHPERCGWCDYPKSDLIAALDWATHDSALVTEEWMAWQVDGQRYRRPTGRSGQYLNAAYERFRRMQPEDQTKEVNQAVEDSRG